MTKSGKSPTELIQELFDDFNNKLTSLELEVWWEQHVQAERSKKQIVR